jgi:hypothetical protein
MDPPSAGLRDAGGGCAPLRGTVTEVRNAQCGDFKVSIAQDEKPVREARGEDLIGFRIQVTYMGEGNIQVWHSSPLCSVALYRGGEELLPAMRQDELCTQRVACQAEARFLVE